MEWIGDRGTDTIDPARRGMLPYFGNVPQSAVDAPGYGNCEPQAFLVEMGGDSPALRTHFHVVDQFQYFAHGSGTFGRHPVGAGTVHYADRFTPYGPLTPSTVGVSFVTIRTVSDTGAFFMPDARHDLAEKLDGLPGGAASRRHITLDLRDPANRADGSGWRDLVADDDGLHIAVASLGPGATLETPVVGSLGGYLIVVSGEVSGPDGPLPPSSLSWIEPGSTTVVTGSGAGADVALLQQPCAAAAAA